MGIPGRRSLRSTEQVLLLVPFATLQLCRIAPSQLLAPRFGMGYLWRSDCSLGLSLTHFTLTYKFSFLAEPESRVLLSSRLGGAL